MRRLTAGLIVFVTFAACTRVASVQAPTPASVPAPVAAPVTSSPLPTAPGREEREYLGAYTRGFEASWFAPCGAPVDDALWWVTLTEDARLQRDSLLKSITRPATGALVVRWRGTTSARMPAGQMGRGSRYMLVTRILDLRPLPGEGACSPAFRSS